MALSISRVGTSPLSVDLRSLRTTAASPLQNVVKLALNSATVNASGSATLRCTCMACSDSSAGTVQRAATTTTDYTDSIKRSGRKNVDALLAGGNRWFHSAGGSGEVPSATARKTLTFSFMESTAGLAASDASGFQALGSTHRERVRDALDYLSSVIDVQFTEVGSGGDLSYGSNVQASSAGYARYPNEGSQIMMANNQSSFAGGWDEGSYGWQTLLHETAHALGLKHPGAYNAGGGTTPGPYLPGGADHRGNTIMSYNNAKNMTRVIYDNGAFTKNTINADSFQGYDIEALQYLYGASTTTSAKTYAFDDNPYMSRTLWNPSAGSSIDLSNQTGTNVLDLRAGKFSSIGVRDAYADMPYTQKQYAALKAGNGKSLVSLLGKPTYTGQNNLLVAAGSQFTVGKGGSGSDSLVANTVGGSVDGGAGNDSLYWSGGNLQATGGQGSDTLLLKKVSGAVWAVNAEGTQAVLTRTDSKTKAVTTLATVQMSGIETVRYWNGNALKATGATLYAAAASPPAAAALSASA